MKKIFSFFLCICALSVVAQKKIIYDANAEKRPVAPFHAVEVSSGIQLMITQGGEEALAISAQSPEHANAIKTEVVNGELRIYIKQDMQKWWQQLRKKGVQVKAYVSAKQLDKLEGSSGAKITIDGTLNSNKLNVELSSGAFLTGSLAVTTLDIELSSGAKSKIEGQVENLSVEANSGAHFYGFDLSASTAKADANSGGKMELTVNKDLKAEASSGGGITYKGAGGISNVSTSSGGKVRKAS